MPEIKINVYRHATHGNAWCYALWVDGRYDCSDTLDCADDASDDDALECARTMPLVVTGQREVARIEDA